MLLLIFPPDLWSKVEILQFEASPRSVATVTTFTDQKLSTWRLRRRRRRTWRNRKLSTARWEVPLRVKYFKNKWFCSSIRCLSESIGSIFIKCAISVPKRSFSLSFQMHQSLILYIFTIVNFVVERLTKYFYKIWVDKTHCDSSIAIYYRKELIKFVTRRDEC